MARCPYLDFESWGPFSSQEEYRCKLCGKTLTEQEVKYKCKVDYGDAYEQCPVYKDR